MHFVKEFYFAHSFTEAQVLVSSKRKTAKAPFATATKWLWPFQAVCWRDDSCCVALCKKIGPPFQVHIRYFPDSFPCGFIMCKKVNCHVLTFVICELTCSCCANLSVSWCWILQPLLYLFFGAFMTTDLQGSGRALLLLFTLRLSWCRRTSSFSFLKSFSW